MRLEEFVDDNRHGMALQLEPQGLLFAEVSLIYIIIGALEERYPYDDTFLIITLKKVKHLLIFQIKFLNPMITRKPKLRRQRKIFRQQGKIPRPDQMNINVAAWGRLLQRNFFFQKSGEISEGGSRLEKQSSSTGLYIT